MTADISSNNVDSRSTFDRNNYFSSRFCLYAVLGDVSPAVTTRESLPAVKCLFVLRDAQSADRSKARPRPLTDRLPRPVAADSGRYCVIALSFP